MSHNPFLKLAQHPPPPAAQPYLPPRPSPAPEPARDKLHNKSFRLSTRNMREVNQLLARDGLQLQPLLFDLLRTWCASRGVQLDDQQPAGPKP